MKVRDMHQHVHATASSAQSDGVTIRRRRFVLQGATTLSAAALAPLAVRAFAQDYPTKPVRIVVPYPAGGPTDVAARILAQEFQKRMGQSFMVDNRPGAGGMLGAAEVARAAPDGYNLLVNASAHVIYPAIFKVVKYDVLADFTPISQLVEVPLVMVISPKVPAGNLRELLAYAKANPGKMSYASAGNGGAPHLSGELLKQMAGINVVHVPYKGSAPALTDLMGGQVDYMFDSMSSAMKHVQSGKLRAFAVSTGKRSALAPNVPTVAEAGVPGYELMNWYGFWGPKNMPPALAARLASEAAAAFADPAVGERIRALGASPATNQPAVFAAFCASEKTKWGKIAADSGAEQE
jgi:tripartite-type tricarboxylate transporter receptor subunit TctC